VRHAAVLVPLVALALASSAGATGHALRYTLTYEQRYHFADQSSELFTVSLSTGRPRQLTHNKAYDDRPAWSPDGRELAFISDRGPLGGYELFVMAADGSDVHQLTPDSSGGGNLDPAWSPDGARLAYVHAGVVEITDRAGTTQAPILETAGAYVRDPAWSPDGKRIAYVRDGFLFSIAVDGSDNRRVATGVTQDGRPAWSPDGKRIAFASARTSDGDSDIFVVDADGRNVRDLTNHPAFDGAPAWSPDGHWLAFTSDRLANYHTEIYVMRSDGSGLTRVTHTGLNWQHDSPAWRPRR
jgi:Tol biopolymer transport system component